MADVGNAFVASANAMWACPLSRADTSWPRISLSATAGFTAIVVPSPPSSCRRRLPVLLGHHVRAVPVGPVRIALPEPLLVLSVGGLRPPQRARQIRGGRESSHSGVYPTGQPSRDLLQQPAVAVGITKRCERLVTAMLGIRTADPMPPEQVGLVRAGMDAAGAVEHLADLGTPAEKLLPRGLDVGDDQVQALGGARRGRGDVPTEDHRAP